MSDRLIQAEINRRGIALVRAAMAAAGIATGPRTTELDRQLADLRTKRGTEPEENRP